MVLEASPADLKRISKNARTKATPDEESVFYKDLRYALVTAREGHSEEAHKLVMQVTTYAYADKSVQEFGRAVETHGAHFVDAMLPRYELALKAHPHLKQTFRDDWFETLHDFIEIASQEYRPLDWSNGSKLQTMMQVVETRLRERIDYASRGIVTPPTPKWHERHPVVYAVGLIVFGAVLGGVADAVVKALTGS